MIVNIDNVTEDKGVLSFFENGNFPFNIKRVFYMYNIPNRAKRGGHAHKNCHQVIICLKGSVNLKLYYQQEKKIIPLKSPKTGFHIKPLTWVELEFFTKGCICLVACSDIYEKSDYIHDYNELETIYWSKNI